MASLCGSEPPSNFTDREGPSLRREMYSVQPCLACGEKRAYPGIIHNSNSLPPCVCRDNYRINFSHAAPCLMRTVEETTASPR